MRRSALALTLFALAPAPCLAAAQTGTSSDNIAGQPTTKGNSFPTTVYDANTHQRITYKLDRVEGGYVRGEDTVTGRQWHADIAPGGAMRGRDLDGADWDYAPATHTYTNRTAKRTCAQTTLTHVCPPAMTVRGR